MGVGVLWQFLHAAPVVPHVKMRQTYLQTMNSVSLFERKQKTVTLDEISMTNIFSCESDTWGW